jgi:3-oxoacyl-[acyl-carrier-protein] synthase-3
MAVSGENIFPLARNATGHVRNLLSREVASLTVGDAGAAMIVEQAPDDSQDILFGLTTVAKHSRLCVAHVDHDDPGARMFTKPVALHNAAMKNMPVVYQQVLETLGVPLEEVHHVIPHQTSKAAIKTGIRKITEHLGQSLHSHAVMTVDRYGNTASTSHTVAFVDELDGEHVSAGERVAMLALASGLVVGAMVFTADDALVASRSSQATKTTSGSDPHSSGNGNINLTGKRDINLTGNIDEALVGSHANNN